MGEVVARWREAREWWQFEAAREFVQTVDAKGIKRTTETVLPSIGKLVVSGQGPVTHDNRDEWSLRERKIRNETFAAACGDLPPAYYERVAKERREGSAPTIAASNSSPVGIAKQPKVSSYAPLHLVSGYAFGESAILAEELAKLSAGIGCPAACLADPFSLIGASEFARAMKLYGAKALIGASVELAEGGELVLIAKSQDGYRSLSRLISACHLGEPRGYPLCSWERLAEHADGLLCLTGGSQGVLDRLLIRRDFKAARVLLQKLVGLFGKDDVFLEIERSYLPWQIAVEGHLTRLADEFGLTEVAGGRVTHARPQHFPAQDVLACVESLCLLEDAVGRKPRRDEAQPQVTEPPFRALNAERYLRTPKEMAALFADRPELLRATNRVAERCDAWVLPPRTTLPRLFDDEATAFREIVGAGANHAWLKVTPKIEQRLKMEVGRIIDLGFASHFLAAWDMCRFAREQGIQFSGRGSVVDAAVSFALGFSRVDAVRHNLLFDRFLPSDGTKRPDIDIDFEAHKRDDVRGYLVRRYGVEHVATVAAIGTYRSRGIVREVGKVFGLPQNAIGYLAKRIHGGISPDELEASLTDRPELRDSGIPKEKFKWVFDLAERLMDVPRNIRCHSSGVVLSSEPITDTVPVMWSASDNAEESGWSGEALRIIQWDKRSAKHYFDKFDVLCLRGQDVLAGTERRIRVAGSDFSVERLAATDDPEVYRAMRSGELIGVPQSASPAMRQAHMRLRTADLHDASLVQAGIRPGVGGAVKINELIARRRGKPYSFSHPKLEQILGHTYGIIVFQEQVDELLQVFCGYSAGEAEDTRDLIHKRRKEDYGASIRAALVARVIERGYSAEVAEQVFEYVAGFKGYGFAQGHALAFAEVSLRSVWCMQNHPAAYFAALLSAQPAGYYGPATIANEARIRGVSMLPLDINRSRAEFTVESVTDAATSLSVPNAGIRVALAQLAGLSANTRERVFAQLCHAEAQAREERLSLPAVAKERHGNVAVAERPGSNGDGDRADRRPPLLAFNSIFDFAVKVRPDEDELSALILAGAFDSLHPNRRALLWAMPQTKAFAETVASTLERGALPLELQSPKLDSEVSDFSAAEKAVYERALLGLDVKEHVMAFERERIAAKCGVTTAKARRTPAGTRLIVVGNPIRLRFPPTASGKRVVFFDLEDETGLLNVTCFDDVYGRDGQAIVCSQYVTLLGVTQDRDGHLAFLAHRVFPYQPSLAKAAGPLPLPTSDFLVG